MDRYTKRGESQRSVPSYLVGNTPDGLSKPATKRGHPKGSTIKTKSTHGASRASSKKKQSSGTKDVKRGRGRPPKKSTK